MNQVERYLVRWALLLLCSTISVSSLAQTTSSYKPFRVPVDSGDQLVISGFRGSVRLIAVPGAKQMTVELKNVGPEALPAGLAEPAEEWLFSLKKEQGRILAQVGSPVSAEAWASYIAEPKFLPEFHVIVRGPSVPSVVSWKSGPVQIENWKSSLDLNLLDSSLSLRSTQGVVQISQQAGEAQVLGHEGPISLDSYDVNARLQAVQGEVSIQNFRGSTEVVESVGRVEVSSYSGQVKVDKGKGQIRFESERGKILVQGYEGDLNSETDLGSIRAQLVGKSRVRIKTRQGNVSLRMPNSGANVNVGTEKGYLNVPNHLRYTRLPNLRLMTGRLKGKNSGRVFVRTESGEIKLR